jgi:hypothetical protein
MANIEKKCYTFLEWMEYIKNEYRFEPVTTDISNQLTSQQNEG